MILCNIGQKVDVSSYLLLINYSLFFNKRFIRCISSRQVFKQPKSDESSLLTVNYIGY